MAELNTIMLNNAVSRAVNEKKETCKSEVLMSRARLRYQLETNEVLQKIKVAIEKNQATMTQIGYPAIKRYVEIFKQEQEERIAKESAKVEKSQKK